MTCPDIDTEIALVLLAAAGGGHAWRRALLEDCVDPNAALSTPTRWRAAQAPESSQAALRQRNLAAINRYLQWKAGGPQRRAMGWQDADYPSLLRETNNPPAVLFLEGDASLLWWPQIAVVGSRAPTPLGQELAAEFSAAFASAGWVVTSGLAEGIDAAAHVAALRCGRTVAVLGTGPDTSYPAFHEDLQATIGRDGLLVSEHPPGTTAQRSHFPSRNRLLAGLSMATVVIEAAERSGALITARLAAEGGREVFALPGSLRNVKARGCHRLLRDGATLATSPQDILDALTQGAFRQFRPALAAAHPPSAPMAAQAGSASAPTEPQNRRVWELLGDEPCHPDALGERTGLTATDLAAILTGLELTGHVTRLPGGYARTSPAP